MFDALGDDIVDMIISQRIVDRLAFSAVTDQLTVFQKAQLM